MTTTSDNNENNTIDDVFKINDSNGHNHHDDHHDESHAVLHSLPHPDEIKLHVPATRHNNNCLQTIATTSGNVLEWYDFAVFGFFGDIIGDTFFPHTDGNAAMIKSFTVFGAAFLMRPIGGILMGYIGDKHGRKKALETSIFLMAFPTFAMGCLPSYDAIGNTATFLLVLVRLLQGLSVGGQLVSSLVYTVEKQPKDKWGLASSYVIGAANLGTLLGGLCAFILRSSLNDEQLKSWGWRIPFLSGILVSISGLYLRYFADEISVSHMHHGDGGGDGMRSQHTNPIREAFRCKNLRSLISASLVPMLWSGGFYVSFVWMAVFMGSILQPPIKEAFAINSLSLFLGVCIFFPFAGMLSDYFGRTLIMYIGGFSLCLLSPILVLIISNGGTLLSIFLAQFTLGIALSLWGSPMGAWLVESFPPHIRLTSVAVGYNMAQATIGGASPALATLIVDRYGVKSPGFLISFIALLSIIGLFIAPKLPPDGSTLISSNTERSERSFECPSEDDRLVRENEMV